jgi:hypothetical protein
VRARFETAEKLNDEDRNAIVDIARKALPAFLPKPDAGMDVKPPAPAAGKAK